MKRLLVILLVVLVTNVSNSQSIIGLTWNPVVEMNDQLFPSYLWATSKYDYTGPGISKDYIGDAEGQLGIELTYSGNRSLNYKLIIECTGYIVNGEISFPLVSAVLLGTKGPVQKQVFPEIMYNYAELAKVKQPIPVTVKYTLYANNEKIGEKYKSVILRSINDCPLTFKHRSGQCNNLNFVFAAYVNDNNPTINNQLLKEVKNTGIANQVIGYQGDINDVYRQVFAVWHILRQRGIVYSSLLNTPQNYNQNKTSIISYQYVRTMDDALTGQQANCIDGTVLMASILYKMGLYPIIVLMPGHAYLGVYSNIAKTEYFFLETTMLNNNYGFDKLDATYSSLGENVSPLSKTNYSSSYSTFLYALQVGMKRYEASKQYFIFNDQGGWFDCTAANLAAMEYQMIDIEFFKSRGVMSLNY